VAQLFVASNNGVMGGHLLLTKKSEVSPLAMGQAAGSKSRACRVCAQLHFHGGGNRGQGQQQTADQGKQKANRDANRRERMAKSKEVCQY